MKRFPFKSCLFHFWKSAILLRSVVTAHHPCARNNGGLFISLAALAAGLSPRVYIAVRNQYIRYVLRLTRTGLGGYIYIFPTCVSKFQNYTPHGRHLARRSPNRPMNDHFLINGHRRPDKMFSLNSNSQVCDIS